MHQDSITAVAISGAHSCLYHHYCLEPHMAKWWPCLVGMCGRPFWGRSSLPFRSRFPPGSKNVPPVPAIFLPRVDLRAETYPPIPHLRGLERDLGCFGCLTYHEIAKYSLGHPTRILNEPMHSLDDLIRKSKWRPARPPAAADGSTQGIDRRAPAYMYSVVLGFGFGLKTATMQ